MSILFGDKKVFALEYALSSNSCLDDKGKNQNWGILKFWINNKDIGLYQYNNKSNYCECNLYDIVEWLCEKLEYIVGYDPFPLPVEANNLLEMIEITDKYESSDDSELNLWYGAKSRWIFNHCWFSCRESSILPCIYFRRIGEVIEISWNNKFWQGNGVMFFSEQGTYNINCFEFKKIIKDFLNSVIDEIEKKNKKRLTQLRTQLNILE